MPLRDHFRSPVNDKHTWDELHGGWPMMIVQQLYDILPAGYIAAPTVHLGKAFEINVTTFQEDEALKLDVVAPIRNLALIRLRSTRSRFATGNGRSSVRSSTYGTTPMTVGQPLPTLPIWLNADLRVLLPLETSHEETCRLLHID